MPSWAMVSAFSMWCFCLCGVKGIVCHCPQPIATQCEAGIRLLYNAVLLRVRLNLTGGLPLGPNLVQEQPRLHDGR